LTDDHRGLPAARRLGFLMTLSASAPAQAERAAAPAEPIRYTVRFPAPQTHYAEVEAVIPAAGRSQIELMMAVWTPGSYLVREFERNVEAVAASAPDGRALVVTKSGKNRWRVVTGGATAVTLRYRVYGRELSVRTNFIESDFALLNGAPTFMTLADGVARPHEVFIVPAAGWTRALTSLTEIGEHHYRADDYDTLVDSPIVAGTPAVYEFSVDGTPHALVDHGEAGVFDGARAAHDLEQIVREYRRMWGSLPYDRYLFLNLITESGGGLEHKSSCVIMTSRWATRTRRAYLDWVELASHEYFHVWNVKRLRPVELGPFAYESEVHTRSLWIAEGLTDYYGDLAVRRAGLSTPDEYLASLSGRIEELQMTPGREVQSASMASYDAWIKFYRPDENSINTTISYYTKGAVLGFLLDASIRESTRGARSLDDVMTRAYARYAGDRGYTGEEFKAVAEDVAGKSLDTFWERYVEGTAELDYSNALATFGLRFRPVPESGRKAWLGIATRNDGGRLVVAQVRRDSPAYLAGLNVDDEILAIDDFRVRADRFEHRLEQYGAGDLVRVLVARREQLTRVDVRLAPEPRRQWRLEIDPAATAAQATALAAWLGIRPSP
jgi:predicted metalloprotease with PDZ domain